MRTKNAPETFKCRFPGCEKEPYKRTQDRGRHELFAHKMKHGVVPPQAPPPRPAVPKALRGPIQRLEEAIEELNKRARAISKEMERMKTLENESSEIGRQLDILSDALKKLVEGAAATA